MVTHAPRLKNTRAYQDGTPTSDGAAPLDTWQVDVPQFAVERLGADDTCSRAVVADHTVGRVLAHRSAADSRHGTPVSLSNVRRYETFEADFRGHHETNTARRHGLYEHYRLVYRYGYDLGVDPRYRSAEWSNVEQAARPRWEERNPGTWEQFKDAIRYAWNTARGAHVMIDQAGATTGRSVTGGAVSEGFGQEASAARTGSILIIDSNAAIVDVLIEILSDEGYTTYAVADEVSACAAMRRHPPALILLDIGIRELSDAARITTLRAAGPALLPIVLLTTAPHAVAPLLVPGSVECLAKPFDLDVLLACVARFVQPASGAALSQHGATSTIGRAGS